MTDKPYAPIRLARLLTTSSNPESATTDRLIAMGRRSPPHGASNTLPPRSCSATCPEAPPAAGPPKPWGRFQNFTTIHALGFFGVHVRAQDGVDPGLVAALPPEPFQQVGVQPQGDQSLRFRKDHPGIPPKFSSVARASGSPSIPARMSAALRRRRASQSVPVLRRFEVLPVVASSMGFRPPRGDEVSLVAVPVGVDHRDFQTVDEADGVNPDFAVVETVVYPFDGRPSKIRLASSKAILCLLTLLGSSRHPKCIASSIFT